VEPQPPIAALVVASNNSNAAKVRFAAKALSPSRASAFLRSIRSSASSMARTNRMGKRLAGFRNKKKGGAGISNPLAVVLTLMVKAAGPVVVMVAGEGEPVHVALEGAPVQLAVTMS